MDISHHRIHLFIQRFVLYFDRERKLFFNVEVKKGIAKLIEAKKYWLHESIISKQSE